MRFRSAIREVALTDTHTHTHTNTHTHTPIDANQTASLSKAGTREFNPISRRHCSFPDGR